MGIMDLAIVGCGPRGLSALESVYTQAALKNKISLLQTTIFDQTNQLGNGPIYDLEQPNSNWLNVSERGLTIPGRAPIIYKELNIPLFPSYQEWRGYNEIEDKTDYFPLRSVLGQYLNERFNSIAKVLVENNLLKIISERVIAIDYQKKKFIINTENNGSYYSDEAVLTIGHQPTSFDEQIEDWTTQVQNKKGLTLLQNPYPVEEVIKATNNENSIGLRGFGLAMIDVVRAITEGKGGNFKTVDKSTRKMVYQPSRTNPIKIVPFSLDGLPMTPKPLNKRVDNWFIPSKEELDTFSNNLQIAIKKVKDLTKGRFVIKAIAPIIVRKFLNLKDQAYTHELSSKELSDIVNTWLENKNFKHRLIVSKDMNAQKSLEKYIGMATGQSKISLDYCIGQVWRHCQPIMYKELSFTELDENIIVELIKRDERLKRYSYGPPVDSLQQLLALVGEGTLNLDFVDNPEITVSNFGWVFKKNNKTITTKIMVDTVLDSPKLMKVESPIIKSLLNDSLVEPVHNELAITTHKNALVQLTDEKQQIPLAILGRLAKGTLIGVDAILECFGIRSKLWAKGVISRIKS